MKIGKKKTREKKNVVKVYEWDSKYNNFRKHTTR